VQIACKFFRNFIFPKGTKMKNTSVKISLDTRRAKADGTYPLILRLTHKRKTTSIKTGVYLKKEDWDEDRLEVKKSYKGASNVTRLNNEIQKKKAEALDSILKLEEKAKRPSLSVTDIKHQIDPDSSSQSFYAFGEKLVKELMIAERIGTARTYQLVLNVLRNFNKGKPFDKSKGGDPKKTKFKPDKYPDLTFEEMDYTFLKKLEHYHLAAGNAFNGLAVYMRTIRSMYNQAIKAGAVDKSLYPFSDYKIKTEPTQKRALEMSYLAKIIALELPNNHPAYDARNFFIASYMMYGMNFADMAYLEKTDIINGRIQYRRRKTSKLYDIKISEGLADILAHYTQRNPTSTYVFPIIKREGAILRQRDIQFGRKEYNENLGTIAGLCGIEQKLTSYVSRHSFATNAMLSNVPVNAISTMLGHSSLKTTEIYLKSLPSNILDEYNAKILEIK
jgi:integrase/recombinase XerD